MSSSHWSASALRATGRSAWSRAAGRSASTDRRASARLSRANRTALLDARLQLGVITHLAFSSLQLRDDAREALSERVMDLPSEAGPLVEYASLARLRDELRVQPGVLRERLLQAGVGRLQVADCLPTLLVLPFDDQTVIAEPGRQASIHEPQQSEGGELDRRRREDATHLGNRGQRRCRHDGDRPRGGTRTAAARRCSRRTCRYRTTDWPARAALPAPNGQRRRPSRGRCLARCARTWCPGSRSTRPRLQRAQPPR